MKKLFFGVFVFFICGDVICLPLAKPWYQSNLEQFNSGVQISEDGLEKYGYLKSTRKKPVGRGSALQHISPSNEWLGKRVRLTARLKSNLSWGYAGMFMSIEGSYEKASDYMHGRKLNGVQDWREYSIVLDVPYEPKADILFGVALEGKGEVFFDDFKFEIVDYDVAVTGKVQEKIKRSGPSNLNFENVDLD